MNIQLSIVFFSVSVQFPGIALEPVPGKDSMLRVVTDDDAFREIDDIFPPSQRGYTPDCRDEDVHMAAGTDEGKVPGIDAAVQTEDLYVQAARTDEGKIPGVDCSVQTDEPKPTPDAPKPDEPTPDKPIPDKPTPDETTPDKRKPITEDLCVQAGNGVTTIQQAKGVLVGKNFKVMSMAKRLDLGAFRRMQNRSKMNKVMFKRKEKTVATPAVAIAVSSQAPSKCPESATATPAVAVFSPVPSTSAYNPSPSPSTSSSSSSDKRNRLTTKKRKSEATQPTQPPKKAFIPPPPPPKPLLSRPPLQNVDPAPTRLWSMPCNPQIAPKCPVVPEVPKVHVAPNVPMYFTAGYREAQAAQDAKELMREAAIAAEIIERDYLD